MKLDKENMSPNVKKAGVFMLVASLLSAAYLLVTTVYMFFTGL